MNKKRCFIIQPSGYGDIIMCLPIAKKYYHEGFEIVWPIDKKMLNIFDNINYIKPLVLNTNQSDLIGDYLRNMFVRISNILLNYIKKDDIVLNLCDRRNFGEWNSLYNNFTTQLECENFIEYKYRISNCDFLSARLDWKRNFEKENELKNKIIASDNYSFIHNTSSTEIQDVVPNYSPVFAKPIDGYNIFDWYKIILDAKEIIVVESSFHCFIEFSDIQTNNMFVIRGRSGNKSPFKYYKKQWKIKEV